MRRSYSSDTTRRMMQRWDDTNGCYHVNWEHPTLLSREELIKNIKDLGQELVDRAEEIVGDDELNEFVMNIHVNDHELPNISLHKDRYSRYAKERVMNDLGVGDGEH